MIKRIIKNFTPPIVSGFIRFFTDKVKWYGNYSSWNDAIKHSLGYDSNGILEKVTRSSLAVKNGEAIFERDSVLFYKQEYNWPLLTSIFFASNKLSRLHLTDFGGALGSTYYQNKALLATIGNLKWSVIEQSNYVDTGIKQFTTDSLKFYYTIEACLENQQADILLLSSVLQYLQDPLSFIKEIGKFGFEFIFIDRTGFVSSDQHRITVQKISSKIYDASYPAWFFSEKKLIDLLLDDYDVVLDFSASDAANIKGSYYKGFLLQRAAKKN